MKTKKQPPSLPALALMWIAGIQDQQAGLQVIGGQHREALAALGEDYLRLLRKAEHCAKNHARPTAGRKPEGKRALTSTERSGKARAKRAAEK